MVAATTVTTTECVTAASIVDPIPRKRVTRSRSQKKNSCTATTSNNNDSIGKKKTGEAAKCTTDGLSNIHSPPVVVTSSYFHTGSTVATESQLEQQQRSPQVTVVNNAIEPTASSSDDDNDEWEEVDQGASDDGMDEGQDMDSIAGGDDIDVQMAHYKPSVDGVLQIEIESGSGAKGATKKSLDPWEAKRRKTNAQKRQNQIHLHKTHLLCFIGCGIHLNVLTFLPHIQGISLSLVDFVFPKVPSSLDLKTIEKLIQNFTRAFKYTPDEDVDGDEEALSTSKSTSASSPKVNGVSPTVQTEMKKGPSIEERLVHCLTHRKARNSLEYILAFVSLLRIMRFNLKKDLQVRLCLGMNPVTVHPSGLIPSKKQEASAVRNKKQPASTNSTTKGKYKSKNKRGVLSSSDESDYEIQVTRMSRAKTLNPTKRSTAKAVKESPPKTTLAVWPEVHLDSGRWVSLYFLDSILIDDPNALISKLKINPLYVFAFDDLNRLKDVTARYATNFLEPSFRKDRADGKWLDATLSKFTSSSISKEDENEDYELQIKLSERPMPKSIAAFKNHPFYILKRHLLVYEAIYPNDAQPVAFFHDEPVYDRNNVRFVRSKEFWKREARVVKPNEEAYKFTKGKKKWSRALKVYIDDPPRELFGEWQTEPYDPPTAENGIVPRNEFNNVELFKPSMLPKGCVHLRIPGLLKVAKKLNIDCVPAVIGFDNVKGSGGVVPTFDGFVVCEEFAEILIEAHQEEEFNKEQKKHSKRLARIYANWRRLTKALLIRQKLREKYSDCT